MIVWVLFYPIFAAPFVAYPLHCCDDFDGFIVIGYPLLSVIFCVVLFDTVSCHCWFVVFDMLGIIFVLPVWCLSTALAPFVVKRRPCRRSRRLQSLRRKVDYFPSRTRYIRAPHTVLSPASSIGSTEVINCTTTSTPFERNFINFYLTCGNIYF